MLITIISVGSLTFPKRSDKYLELSILLTREKTQRVCEQNSILRVAFSISFHEVEYFQVNILVNEYQVYIMLQF